MRPAGLAPLIASLSLVLHAPVSRLAADPLPKTAPALDFAARASALEAAADPGSLVQAVVLRRALGETERADADSDHFLAQLAADPSHAEQAAAAYLAEVLDPTAWPDSARWEAALRRLLAHVPASAPSAALRSVRTQAEVLLAAHLWETSCTLDPQARSDSACIQRIDATAEYKANFLAKKEVARRSEKPFSLAPQICDPPIYRYRVHPRRSALVREAQSRLAQSIRRAPALLQALPQDAVLQEAFAHALFLQAELHFEAALADRLPFDLTGEQKKVSRPAALRARIDAWLAERTNIRPRRLLLSAPIVREHRFYEAIIARSVPSWSIAAYARLAQLSLDVTDQWFRSSIHVTPKPPPPPLGLSQEKWANFFHDAYCEQTFGDLPFERETLAALSRCNEESSRAMLDTPYARTCLDLLRRLHPSDTNEAREIFAHPPRQSPLALTRSEPAPLQE